MAGRCIKAIGGLKTAGLMAILVAAMVVSLIAGYGLRGLVDGDSSPHEHEDGAPTAGHAPGRHDEAPAWWTCSMHPQIRLPKPGLCPICNMDLIPLRTDADTVSAPRRLAVSESAAKLMEIATAPVERRFVEARVRMVGKIDYDQTRLKTITAWIGGRVDRLYVDYTGVPVRQGDHLAELYSPELLGAQAELLAALETVKGLGDDEASFVRRTSEATVAAAREKLRLWGLKAEQIAEIEKRGTASDHMTIYSPIGGIVIGKDVQEGMYLQTGTRLYTVADLSQVWVRLDAYESDLMWLRYGQKVEFTTEAYPGERFTGTIALIDPVLTQATRTVKVRVNAANPDMRLKPGMFVRAVAAAQVAASGRVMDVALAGKWICPMHPDVVAETAGECELCGMPLVRTESLGYVSVDTAERVKPLVIPASAPLITGERAIVYVQVPDADSPTYEGREITLGPRAGSHYLVRGGLVEGQRVVVKGAFKIDAELQIQAKPSMMAGEGGLP